MSLEEFANFLTDLLGLVDGREVRIELKPHPPDYAPVRDHGEEEGLDIVDCVRWVVIEVPSGEPLRSGPYKKTPEDAFKAFLPYYKLLYDQLHGHDR